MADPIRIISLCSGVGTLDAGVELGLEHLGARGRVLCYVERDAYAASCLLARMADAALEPAPVWCGNLQDVGWTRFRGMADLVVAGFPCQPVSVAGKQRATDDERWIWPYIADAIRAIGPRFVFLENVRGLLAGHGGLDEVFRGLAGLGFDAQWSVLRASAVGANHQRERVFILAYREGGRLGSGWQRAGEPVDAQPCGDVLADDEHARQRIERPAYDDDRRHAPGHDANGCDSALAIAADERLERGEGARRQARRGPELASGVGDAVLARSQEDRPAVEERRRIAGAADAGALPIFAPGPEDTRWRDIIAERPDLAPAVEPGFRVLADGLAVVVDESRADQLRAIGNGVVPPQAALAFVELARRAGITGRK